MTNHIDDQAPFYGQYLTPDECWSLYESMRTDETSFDRWESGYTSREMQGFKSANQAHSLFETDARLSFRFNTYHVSSAVFFNKSAAFAQMELDSSPTNEDLYMQEEAERDAVYTIAFLEHHHLSHHIAPDQDPAWKVDSDRITQLLSAA